MPKTSINYSNTIIYKIACKDTNITDCYVGHTTNFPNRKYMHYIDYNKFPERKLYKFMDMNGGYDNFEMIEIETIDCKTNNEAKRRERYWCEQLNSTLNSITPIFLNSEGLSTDDIKHEDKKELNKLKTLFRQRQDRILLLQLQKENKELKEQIKRLTLVVKE
jgi:hypothetical protein